MNTISVRSAKAPDPGRVLAKAVLKAADFLELTHAEVAEILGVSPASVSRIASGHRSVPVDGKEGQLAVLFLRLFRSLDALMGGRESRSRDWLHAPNHHLGGVPVELILSVEGLVSVVHYLDAMRARI